MAGIWRHSIARYDGWGNEASLPPHHLSISSHVLQWFRHIRHHWEYRRLTFPHWGFSLIPQIIQSKILLIFASSKGGILVHCYQVISAFLLSVCVLFCVQDSSVGVHVCALWLQESQKAPWGKKMLIEYEWRCMCDRPDDQGLKCEVLRAGHDLMKDYNPPPLPFFASSFSCIKKLSVLF